MTQRLPRQTGLAEARPVKYRRLPVPDVSTGGGGTAVIRWGPDFGTLGGDSLPQKSTLAMPNVGVSAALAQVHTLGGTIGVGPFSGPNQVQALAATINPSFSGPNQVQAIRHTALGLSGALGQVQAVRNPLVGLSSAVAQVHALGGKALGSPFWQSVATKTLATTLGATSIVANNPTGIQVGDLLVAFVCEQEAVAPAGGINVPTGWSFASQAGGGAFNHYGFVVYKKANGTEGTTTTFTFAGTALRATAEIHRIVGQDPTAPLDSVGSSNFNAINATVGTITTVATNCLVFAFVVHQHALTQAHSPPAGHVERTDFQDQNTTFLGSSSYTRVFAAAGATGTATVTCNELAASDGSWLRVAFAPGEVIF